MSSGGRKLRVRTESVNIRRMQLLSWHNGKDKNGACQQTSSVVEIMSFSIIDKAHCLLDKEWKWC